MMQASLSRGYVSGVTVIISARGLLSSLHSGPSGGSHVGSEATGAPVPAKLQLLNHKHSGYTIKVISNNNTPQVPPLIDADLSGISVLSHTAEEFTFALDKDGSRHTMTFSNIADGKQFKAIFAAVNVQKLPKMTSKRNTTAMAARFPAMDPGSGMGGAVKKNPQQVAVNGTELDLDLHTFVDLLKASISDGDVQNAQMYAGQLAVLSPKLSIIVENTGPCQSQTDNISIQIQVEDKHSPKMKLRMSVSPNITIAGLKKEILLKYGVPTKVQNWIVGRKLVKDSETLASLNVTTSGATLYLYLTSADRANITREDMEIEKHAMIDQRASQKQKPPNDRRTQLSRERVVPPSPTGTMQAVRPKQSVLTQNSPRRSRERIGEPSAVVVEPLRRSSPETRGERRRENVLPDALDVGWACPVCTLVNPPLIPGCQACSESRPASYSPPSQVTYRLHPTESIYLENLKREEEAHSKVGRSQKLLNYQEHLNMEGKDLVPNREPFECLICCVDVAEGDGVVLRECVHTFCKDCLREHIRQSQDPLVICPWTDGSSPCDAPITEREVKALLSKEEFEKFLERGLRRAESTADNSFHCKTADCMGFCFYEDNNNFFTCALCKRVNCLTCKAIHEGINCKQYQEDLKIRAQNDVTAKQTQDALQELVRTGEAMHCPRCSVIVQKKGGCDWLRCSMCQLEICWVTKQARWGPGGSGDLSGGCGCRVNGLKCHPNCHNCH
ncbi:ranBP-type and C3HC4-type zinc finger-containing protein 1-like [Diadema antillarum]|uniref:ranBP-type and C3HC4-type zinc finger-containing protein 1-like n=1 Tax=Diadema antillarum TaxID=105358 RepID=UPI003A865211